MSNKRANAKERLFITLCAVLIFPAAGLAAVAPPFISSVSSVLSHGQNVTITGSSFGTKSPAAPIKWDNFESYPDGADMVVNAGYDNLGGDGSKAYIKTDNFFGNNGSKSAKMDYTTGKNSMFPRIGTNLPSGTMELYVTYQAYWTHYTGTESAPFIFKWTRGGSNPSYSGVPKFYETVRPNSAGTVTGTDRGFVTDTGTTYAQNVVAGQNAKLWNRVEYHYKLSNPPGTANGAYEQWVNNKKNVDLIGKITRTANEPNSTIDYVMSPFDGNDSYGNTNGYFFWFDDYYIDNTPARVEVCSGSTWDTKGNCTIQIPVAWSSTSITFTVNQGSIPSNGSGYLYVVDVNQTPSNGVLVNFGDSVSPPSNLKPTTILK
ncbi:IPT/TIG domain-containing protein [Geomonas propionica]|uniref:IPT/TIG domain-containing protein n=1 Tax=Geomonas propionica TaxID=2798582 RepID=A0ABS0YTY7_9BACT|nr:IPT/TIG domain-containing protein [Geomonas propionica]MBJ6801435.1 hypothetical protein [Geomonas propionica]